MPYVSAQYLHPATLSDAQRSRLVQRARTLVTLDVVGMNVGVYFEDPEAAEVLRWRYVAFASQGEPQLRCYVGYDEGLGVAFSVEGGPESYWPTKLIPRHIAFLADAVSMKAAFKKRTDVLCFHAAAVRVDNVAAAIIANTEGGKTTTAIACMRRGMPLYTDERCVISKGNVVAFPRNVNVRAHSLRLLLAEQPHPDAGINERLRGKAGGDWHSASYGELFGPVAAPSPSPLGAMFFIRSAQGGPSVSPMSISDAVLELQSVGGVVSGVKGLDRMVMLTSMLKHARCYNLFLGTPDQTALLIADTVRGAVPSSLSQSA